ncbi:MAG: hypothetical protein E2598_07645 [Sphingobium sp.]|nr:hypothetical protein [Sphingobium sp.]
MNRPCLHHSFRVEIQRRAIAWAGIVAAKSGDDRHQMMAKAMVDIGLWHRVANTLAYGWQMHHPWGEQATRIFFLPAAIANSANHDDLFHDRMTDADWPRAQTSVDNTWDKAAAHHAANPADENHPRHIGCIRFWLAYHMAQYSISQQQEAA